MQPQPQRAASIAAMSIFLIVIIASNAHLGPQLRGNGHTRSHPFHKKKPLSRTNCPILPQPASSSPENQDKDVLDPPHRTCYTKTVRKQVLIISTDTTASGTDAPATIGMPT